jgi:hypothetical protein
LGIETSDIRFVVFQKPSGKRPNSGFNTEGRRLTSLSSGARPARGSAPGGKRIEFPGFSLEFSEVAQEKFVNRELRMRLVMYRERICSK